MFMRAKLLGFTLIEIIISLFIFSIVSIIVTSALHNILNMQSAAEKKATRLAQLQITLLVMSRDIEQVLNRPITNASGQIEGFVGTANTMTFTHAGLANPFGQLPRSTLQRTRYELNNGILERLTWPMLDQTNGTKPDVKSLLNAVKELHFEYLDNKKHFQSVWPPPDPQQAMLPLAVRVSLTLDDWGKISQLYIIPGRSLEKTDQPSN